MNKFLIYGLKNPKSQEIRYIGRSSSGLKRPQEHLRPHQLNKKSYKSSWIKALLKKSIKPEIVTIQEFSSHEYLNDAEIYWMSYFKENGHRLVNHTEGGKGINGYKHTEEARKKIAKASKAMWKKGRRPLTEEEKYKCGSSTRGIEFSTEKKEKWAKAKGAKPFSVFKDGLYIGTWINKSECSRILKLDRKCINQCLNKVSKQHRGYTFEKGSYK